MSEPTVELLAPRTVRIVRRFGASPERVFRCLTDPDELARWFPESIDGSLAVGTRSTLVWPNTRSWWDVTVLRPPTTFEFRWPWLADDSYQTTVRIELRPIGQGTRIDLRDGPFDIRLPGVLDAYSEACEGWGEALAFLRGFVDFSVELRPVAY